MREHKAGLRRIESRCEKKLPRDREVEDREHPEHGGRGKHSQPPQPIDCNRLSNRRKKIVDWSRWPLTWLSNRGASSSNSISDGEKTHE